MKEYDLIKIFDSMKTNEISEVIIKDAGRVYEIRRGTTKQQQAAQFVQAPVAVAPPVSAQPTATPSASFNQRANTEAPAPAPAAETSSDKYFPVKSPLVGTFYASAKPDAPAIVEVGSKVTKGMTLCIVEAMKNFNEIESEVDGIVREVCVKNGDIIEYGQVLFKIETSN